MYNLSIKNNHITLLQQDENMKLLKHQFITGHYIYHNYLLVDKNNKTLALVSMFKSINEKAILPYSITLIQSYQKGMGELMLVEVIKDTMQGIVMPRTASDKFQSMFIRLCENNPIEIDKNTEFKRSDEDKYHNDYFDYPIILTDVEPLIKIEKMNKDKVIEFSTLSN